MAKEQEIKDIGKEIAQKLKVAGYDTPEKIANATSTELKSEAGIDEDVAVSMIEMAKKIKPKQEVGLKKEEKLSIKEKTVVAKEKEIAKPIERVQIATQPTSSLSKGTARNVLVQEIVAKLSKKMKKSIVEESIQNINQREKIYKKILADNDARKILISKIADKLID